MSSHDSTVYEQTCFDVHWSMQVEFILMGGTFMSLPLDYRDYFVRNLHDALSGHSSSNVREAVKFSEQSRTRCIGLTIETRPDYCLTPHLTQVYMLSLCSQAESHCLVGRSYTTTMRLDFLHIPV